VNIWTQTVANIPFAAIPADWPGNFWWHLIILTVLLIGFLMTCVIIFIWM
jgi:hypothetical protein